MKPCLRIAVILFVAMLLAVATHAQTAKLIPVWNASDENNVARIDHTAWQEILNDYLRKHDSGVNRFDYAVLKANARDTAKLSSYLTYLQSFDPRIYSQAEQKAYWINFYNALTVKVVTDAYPVKSIKDISESLLGKLGRIFGGPWDDVHAKVAGLDLTLNNIEHGILRPIWKDNRIHYAVNCASYGCPNLSATAFTAENTEELLDAGARAYVNHPRGVDFVDDDFLVISSIYKWYVTDFGGDEKSVINHLVKYADKALATRLRKFTGSVDYEYDWSLNQP
ncbi:MAG: DUF547 domain-containing protein [Nitrospira sp. SB0677_bin_15]|nr:DUF547 domain-containing protein [Nitrospira sp. SB0667_bin_9]MYD31566.1 DUF547 domain-containing protein [Nitrospira sp. SB0661_bin_20]MYG40777.1 DUF547 domain-containing protein [Nitrospira sp. SB0677_bin_15]MYH01067.1 DUF547 domain-containing protein [Nitrospira sp. SB0675_bin_23]MYJ23939.1 DUF547 domain-containing protein [Nitrospira sp. SB0673_bin_12]